MPVPMHISELLKLIPNKAGVYQFYDKSENLLYVGKAKLLKRRVSSYFKKKQKHRKTSILVSKIHDIKYLVVAT